MPALLLGNLTRASLSIVTSVTGIWGRAAGPRWCGWLSMCRWNPCPATSGHHAGGRRLEDISSPAQSTYRGITTACGSAPPDQEIGQCRCELAIAARYRWLVAALLLQRFGEESCCVAFLQFLEQPGVPMGISSIGKTLEEVALFRKESYHFCMYICINRNLEGRWNANCPCTGHMLKSFGFGTA